MFSFKIKVPNLAYSMLFILNDYQSVINLYAIYSKYS